MHAASGELEFERAARLRDQLLSVRKAIERQQMVGTRSEDLDVIGIVDDPLEASVQVFFVRKGRVVGRKAVMVDKVEDLDGPPLVARLLELLYGDSSPDDVPKEVLVPVEPEQSRAVRGVPAARCAARRSAIRVPQRGGKRELLATVTTNAQEAMLRHKLRRASDHNAPGPGAHRRSRRHSTSRRRRCGSSASTSRTCRAPRSSGRWS